MLPRLVTVEPAEKLELITVGVGLGVGEGVRFGVGVWAWAWADATAATAKSKTIAMPRKRLRPALVLNVREGHGEQRMNFNPGSERQLEKMPNPHRPKPICADLAGSVNRSGCAVLADCPALLFRGHSWSRAFEPLARFPEPRQRLANP